MLPSFTIRASRLPLALAAWIVAAGGVAQITSQRSATTPRVDPRKGQFEQSRRRAMGMKSPGGSPGAESKARMARLAAKYASRVEAENAGSGRSSPR
jgi:hypothetical protein